jgi:NAD-dependent oxidoreductase involved in siderophore biosynthesis
MLKSLHTISLVVQTHYQLARQALLYGKHVLVEKPLTASAAEAEELVALAHEQRRVLMVGHTFEYSPAVNELRKLVQSGDLGKIYCLEAERLNLGLFRSDINVIILIGSSHCDSSVKILLIQFVWEHNRAHMGGIGLAVVEVLAAAQQALEKQLTNLKQGVK